MWLCGCIACAWQKAAGAQTSCSRGPPEHSVGYMQPGLLLLMGCQPNITSVALPATAAFTHALADGGKILVKPLRPLPDAASPAAADHASPFPPQVLAVVREASAAIKAPLVLFTYYNPIMARGLDKFCRQAKEAGASGALRCAVLCCDVQCLPRCQRPVPWVRCAALGFQAVASEGACRSDGPGWAATCRKQQGGLLVARNETHASAG